MTIKIETIEAARKKLKELPEIEKEKLSVSKQESIRKLKQEILAAQKRGYTLLQIAEILTGADIQITTPTLKSYLQRSNPTKAKTQSKVAKQPLAVATDKPVTAIDEKATKAIESKATEPEKNDGFAKPDTDDI